VLEALATPVGVVLRTIHSLYAGFLDPASGLAWGLSIVTLTIFVRLLLFPLFVKQIKSQRRMQQIAPMVKELQKKHKGDRETLNKELMALYKENNANPISGCLPLLLQLPVFFALFHVIRHFGDDREPRYGLSTQLLEEGGRAQIFGAPISANFRTAAEALAAQDADVTTVRVVAAVMVVLMGATTFWTQRQMIARSGTTDPQQLMIQKFLLYVLPLSFAVSGVIFPIGVLLYWVTTNIWSMGQQAYVIKRMPPPVMPGKGGPPAVKDGKGKDAGKDGKPAAAAGTTLQAEAPDPAPTSNGRKRRRGSSAVPAAPTSSSAAAPGAAPAAAADAPATTTPATTTDDRGGRPAAPGARAATTSPRKAAGSRKNKSRRGGRR
jgi:YidC/Oxa1 family membrane protein insertase